MRREPSYAMSELYSAGEQVAAGVYRDVRTGREIRLEVDDMLPASLDGRVACYVRVRTRRSEANEPRADAAITTARLPERAVV
jgi:hypothetical protein